MSVVDPIARVAEYCRRHGFAATLSRAGIAAKRSLFASRMIVFYCSLDDRRLSQANPSQAGKVRRLTSLAELAPEYFQQITEFWNRKLASKNISERFSKGASLWLVECEGRLAGYGWTLQGSTIEPYYFPLANGDVHFFDFHVFPQYRGRGLNPFLVCHILSELASPNGGRAFIEAAEWNTAQLASLQKTPFHRFGLVRSLKLFGHACVWWTEKQPLPTAKDCVDSTKQSLRMAGSSDS